MSELDYVNITPDLAPHLARLERACFPTTEPEDLLGEREYRAYAEVFPEGVFVALDGDRPVGAGAGIFLDFDFDHPQHTLHEITGEDQCRNHDPDGDWYYGIDIIVHPDNRRRGVGSKLYELRKDLVRRHNRKGIIAGGYMPGYADHIDHMSAQSYVDQVAAGDLYDATLTFQLENGFQVIGVLENYLHDEATGGWASLIVWENPDYR